MRSLMFFAVFTVSLMRRFCFLLLAFLFPLQLFAGTLEPVAKHFVAAPANVLNVGVFAHDDGAGSSTSQLARGGTDAIADAAGDLIDAAGDGDQPDTRQLTAQGDLEDQTLPVPFATLPLDWRPFPHFYPLVNDGTSAFIDLLRPPPLV